MLNQDSVVGSVLMGGDAGIVLRAFLQHNSFASQFFQRFQARLDTRCPLIILVHIKPVDYDPAMYLTLILFNSKPLLPSQFDTSGPHFQDYWRGYDYPS
jgi:hypothetical protein